MNTKNHVIGAVLISLFIGYHPVYAENISRDVEDAITTPAEIVEVGGNSGRTIESWGKQSNKIKELVKQYGEGILPYLRLYVGSPKIQERRGTLQAIFELGTTKNALDIISDFVNDQDRYIREHAQEYIFSNFEPEFIVQNLPLLYQKLISLKKINKIPTGGAILLLGHFKNNEAYKLLIKLRDGNPLHSRYAIVPTVGAVPFNVVVDMALANHNDDTAVSRIRRLLTSDETEPRILKLFFKAILYMNLDLFKDEMIACLNDITEVEGVTSHSDNKLRVCDFAMDGLKFKLGEPGVKTSSKSNALPTTYIRHNDKEIAKYYQKIK